MASTEDNLIPMNTLALPQLNGLKEQLEKELELFMTSHAQLKLAQQRFLQGIASLNELAKLKTQKKEKEDILVPLTSSVYVPGQVFPGRSVLVDIGTGYYVEKSLEQGKDYYERKVTFLKDQMDTIQANIYSKQDSLSAIVAQMQIRMASEAKKQ